jgi:hypothetical protein
LGLDITAYEQVHLTEPHEHEDACWDQGHIRVYTDFGHSLGSLLPERCYTTDGKAIGFRAGSYSGYNEWRAWLSRTALGVEPEVVWHNFDEWKGRPFFELICFSDCEGCIGPEVAYKLARDFDQQDRVRAKSDGYYAELFDRWQRAFELAANDGMVQFH